ncbi:hypothetical protein PSU4_34200 [Pseudonocardia sulfidoxydans NBRC 16205]|uniref:DUF885 domain-containing protein n=1 Tax=Pseudonocardia sulfidoxydans NBRC 16205 TaxID=1223511 RepID=A0A511DI34_9PSEU|nr:DUF885 domain-containing protein [Pseudonocardia sulfidoxydans]GEL24466.1 hypothetical protein PSU4_34200 [Pseudonocardia sulfidoxydans NBRC 16205]
MPPSLVPRDYVLLALRLDRLVPGIVDTWTGDQELRRHAADGPLPDPTDLVRTATRLRRRLGDAGLDVTRTSLLDAQLGALHAHARRAAGDHIGFVDHVRATLDVDLDGNTPDEDRYRAAHTTLDALLPGRGTLTDRLAAFRRRETVPPTRTGAAVDTLLTALRDRTRALYGLPDDEHVDIELVHDRPWTGLTQHLGGLRSHVRIAADAGLRATQLAALVAHETYPGHHAEHCLVRGVRRPGEPERDIVVTPSPHSLVTEGAADTGLDVVAGPDWGPWVADVLADTGIRCDGALAQAVETTLRELAPVRQDAALMIHDRGRPVDDAAAHLRRWLLVDDARADTLLRFVVDPRWRGYTTAYVEGEALVRAWLAAGPDPVTRYRRLLDTPHVPEHLRADLAAAPLGPVIVAPPGPPPSGTTVPSLPGNRPLSGEQRATSGSPNC